MRERKHEAPLLGGQALHTDTVNLNDGSSSLTYLPDVLTVDQVSQFLQIGPNTTRVLCRQNKLPNFRVGVQYRIPKAHLLALIAGGGQ